MKRGPRPPKISWRRAGRGFERVEALKEASARPLASVASGAEEKKEREKRAAKGKELDDFMEELLGKNIAVKLQGGEAIAGRLLETSRFWVKVENASGDVVYVNKAFITTIHPLGKKS